MRRLPPLNSLRAFEAAARLSSVTAAAEELGVSHSAVSQQVKQLEDYFGQRLFNRPGRRVEPTPAAIALLEDVKAAFDRIAVASEQLTRRGVRRIVTVNATDSFAMHWLIPRIAAFQQEYPHFEIRVATAMSDGIAQLDGPYDLIIRSGVMARPGYVCRALMDESATPLLHPRLAAARTFKQPEDLKLAPLLHTRSHADAWRRWFLEHGAPTVETLDGPFFDSMSLAIKAALNGLGAIMAPDAFVAEELAEGRLVAPFPERTLRGAGFHVLFREDAAQERGTRELLRWLDSQTRPLAAAPATALQR